MKAATRFLAPGLILAVATIVGGCATEPTAPPKPMPAPAPAPAPVAPPVAKAPPPPTALQLFESAISKAAAEDNVSLNKTDSGGLVLRAGGDGTFALASSRLNPKFAEFLDELAKTLQAHPKVTVLVTGHTDNVGNAKNNETLSAARAKAVMAQLVKLGVAPERVSAMGKGASEPIASNDSAQGRAVNRRVDILVSEGGR
ncbi:OmpA family protein [Ideonella paludis]|uniref:OmpA family protein n=1 Tax=Ideonella paludis TaxID=1233411 RepID=A0ABS5DYD6_9BURK|nr:OmpA family protein [Ideonella paludis]MBQ0936161.1 OmpA family protein [Ideonella paludis]